MIDLLGRLVPLALGIAASPISIVAVLVILLTRRGRVGSAIFAVTWVASIALALLVATAFAGRISPPRQGLDLPFEGAIAVLLGFSLMSTAALARRGRLRSPDPYRPPAWLTAIDDISPMGGALIAVTNALTSPKNIALAIAAGVALHDYAGNVYEAVAGAIIYVLIGGVTVAVPVLVYFLGGVRTEETLSRWKAVVTSNAVAVMELTVFVLGVVLAAKGLANLLGTLF